MCRKWHTLFLPKKNQRHSSSSSGLSTRLITTFLSSLLLSFSSAPHILLLPHSSHGFKIFISVHLLHSDHPSSSTLGRVIASPAIANHPSCPSTATFYLREIRCQPGNFVDAKKGISIWKGDWENLHFHIASYNNLPFPTAIGLTFSAAGFACPGVPWGKLWLIKSDGRST